MKCFRSLLRCMLLSVAALLLLSSCGGSSTTTADDGAPVVRLDPYRRGTIRTADFVDSVEYLILESTPESMIRRIDRLCVMDSLLLVADNINSFILA
ncbi:6-bladed beta-propeller [uncultured Alistipes sp.]|uniref:6-bladed beta-propeller n=1 Tax=uncultured Alistipes sp. TaxID=538949 RepID=UPI00262BE180|nr:6-bladed beta-propeller [uncultured Alistipes sp.]